MLKKYKKDDYDTKTYAPFKVFHQGDVISLTLDQDDFKYHADGHVLNDIFEDRVKSRFSHYEKDTRFDSESGMFCVYIDSNTKKENIIDDLLKDFLSVFNDSDAMRDYILRFYDVDINLKTQN